MDWAGAEKHQISTSPCNRQQYIAGHPGLCELTFALGVTA